MPSSPFVTPGPPVPVSPVTLPGIAKGATNRTSESFLRKYINKVFKGKGWDALIAALATGDIYNKQLIINALDQLFLATAGGKYLDQRALDSGVLRPNIGIDDETFRNLAIKITASKITYNAIENVLETFYGFKDTRSSVLSPLGAPYALTGHETLTVVINNTTTNIVFEANDFRAPGSASALEVASVITRFLNKNQSLGIAINEKVGSIEHVRIVNNTFGLKGHITVIGGTANAVLGFPLSKQSLYDNPNSSILSRSEDGLDVLLPVTSSAVVRNLSNASYIHGNTPQALNTVSRTVNGLVVATVSDPLGHHMSTGDWVFIDGVQCALSPTVNTSTDLVNGAVAMVGAAGVIMADSKVLLANNFNDYQTYSLDLTTNTYTRLQDTAAKHDTGAFVKLSDTKYMLIGGGTATCEIYHSDTNTWTSAASLPASEVYPFATMLKDGRVLVIGKTTKIPRLYDVGLDSWANGSAPTYAHTSPIIVQLPDERFLMNGGTIHGHTEIYSASQNTWKTVGDTTNFVNKAAGCYVPGIGPSGSVYRFGGANGPDKAFVEKFDLSLEVWTVVTPLNIARSQHVVKLMPDNTVIVISGFGTQTTEIYDIINGTSTTDISVPTAARTYDQIVAIDQWQFLLAGGWADINKYVDKRANVTTAAGFNGHFKITVPVTPPPFMAFTYSTPEFPILSTGSGGTVTSARANASYLGPYAMDPDSGVAITGINTTTTSAFVNTNILDVIDTAGFTPSGYVVFNFGLDSQIGPVKYNLVLSNTALLMSNSFNGNLPIGSTVRLLSQNYPFDPTVTPNGFWLTASTLGRSAASDVLDQVKASGITMTKYVKYPSDRGLGNEGAVLPKVSDKVVVWGGNDVDAEAANAKV